MRACVRACGWAGGRAGGECVHALRDHTAVVRAIALCGDVLVSGSFDGTIKVWDLATGQCERTLKGHTSAVYALAACAGGKMASGSGDNTIKIWSAHGQEARSDERGRGR